MTVPYRVSDGEGAYRTRSKQLALEDPLEAADQIPSSILLFLRRHQRLRIRAFDPNEYGKKSAVLHELQQGLHDKGVRCISCDREATMRSAAGFNMTGTVGHSSKKSRFN